MNWDLVLSVLLDGIFAAIAAIGFAVISNPPRKAILISHGLGFNPLHVMCLVYDRFVQYLFCPVDSLPGRGFFFPFIATHDSRNVCLQDNLGIDPFHENGG